MIADTLIVLLMFLPGPQQKQIENRFTEAFEKADKEFNQKHKIDIQELQKASREAVQAASIKTAQERKRAMNDFCNFEQILKSIKP